MATTAAPAANSSNVSTLSDWAGPYVTNMLGKTEAYTNTPYQVYGGPMTAGESGLQSKVFQGLGSLNFPGNLGQTFSSTGAYQPPQLNMDAYKQQPIGTGQPNMNLNQGSNGMGDFGPQVDAGFGMPIPNQNFSENMQATEPLGSPNVMPQGGLASLMGRMPQQQPQNIAQNYMNPYLQSVLDPQLAELRRQNDITNTAANAKMTQAGAFGGGRQAILNSENNRNLMQEMNKTVGQGYANAYDKAQQQFNVEQSQAKTLADMMAQQGGTQRDIEQQGITADYNEFLNQRDYPQKMLQFQQSMLQGLPISTTTNQAAPMSGIGQLTSTIGGMGNIMDALKKFNLTPS